MKMAQSLLAFLLAVSLVGITGTQLSAQGTDKPGVHRENIEWCDIWITDGGGTHLPRVLLIGDSITRLYYPSVADKLKEKASVSRLSTSKSVGDAMLLLEVRQVLQEYHWDVIHFNNGFHGWDYSEEEYRRAYPDFIATIKKYAPHARLVCATCTPIYTNPSTGQLSPKTERVLVRNQIAVAAATKKNIAIDDLFAHVKDHPEYCSGDGVHPNDKGVAVEAALVADSISPLLAK